MTVNKRLSSIGYLLKFYRARTWLFLVSVLCLVCCYLTVAVIFAFASLVENKSTITFNKYFRDMDYVMTGGGGLDFQNGKLRYQRPIDRALVADFKQRFPTVAVKSFNDDQGKNELVYLGIKGKLSKDELNKYCTDRRIRLSGSFIKPTTDSLYAGIIYELNDHHSRFSFFSFENQVSAFVLGDQLSSEIGLLSKMIFTSAALFTFYITLLYFEERKKEYTIFIIQGFIDLNLKITIIDCLLQNLLAFLVTSCTIPLILHYYTSGQSEMEAGLRGLVYILPYLPVITIIQILVLLNQSLSYAAKFK